MDRLTACSKPLPPTPDDWPLTSHPHPSLVNVPKESKRHCRLLPAGMVNLTLAQMAGAVRNEDKEMKKLKKNRRQVEMFAEYESEGGKCAVGDEYELKIKRTREEGMRMRRERREKKVVVIDDEEEEKGEKVAAVEQQQPKTMDPVDELVSSLHSPSDKLPQQPRKISSSSSSSSAASTPTRPPRATTSRTFETDHKTTTPPRTARNPSHPPNSPTTTTTPNPPTTAHTALHSNPPTATDITHARALTAKYTHSHSHSHTPNPNLTPNHTTTTTTPPPAVTPSRQPPNRNTLATLAPAVVAGQQQQRTTLTRYVSKARRTKRAVGRGLGRVFFGW